jgi:uncharacterized membrane protein
VLSVFRARWHQVVRGLWFLPSLIVVAMIALAVGLVRVDHAFSPASSWVFGADAGAARVVLETLAGSLITVAGIVFSVTIVVLQLASSQFSPRVLPNFLGDRVTQVTVGAFVGIFAYCLVALRSVEGRSVPRLTVTVGSGLGVLAVILLVFFIHHVSTLIQVSQVAGRIAHTTLACLERLYPESFAEPEGEDAAALLAAWREEAEPGRILPRRPGYVQRLDLDQLANALRGRVDRVHVAVAPGDPVSVAAPLLEVWPADAADACEPDAARAFLIDAERDFPQDVGFGVRQLADIALRAISPSVNDPTTAVTCIVYLRSILERLAARRLPAEVRRLEGLVAVVRRQDFDEYLGRLLELGRYGAGDTRLVHHLLSACAGIAAEARRAGAARRVEETRALAGMIAELARGERRPASERRELEELLASV